MLPTTDEDSEAVAEVKDGMKIHVLADVALCLFTRGGRSGVDLRILSSRLKVRDEGVDLRMRLLRLKASDAV